MSISLIEKAILKTLSYFDIFKFPLKEEELYNFLFDIKIEKKEFKRKLNELLKEGIVQSKDGYIYLIGRDSLVKLRKLGEKRAKALLKRGKLLIRIISSFPFVRAIMISGDLSKGVAGKKSDIDYFIIAKSKRIFFLRFLLVTFKRFFLFNSYKYLCPNYIISDKDLEIKEKNIFFAVEIASLLPLYNIFYYDLFLENNRWINNYLPNFKRNGSKSYHPVSLKLKYFLEKIFSHNFFDKLEKKLLFFTKSYFEKKYEDKSNIKDIIVKGINENSAKIHPRDTLSIIEREFEKRLKRLNLV